ncbi:hypothetical protein AVEN_246607-1 [Araneus ventricosus]|uniref:CUB domain-containing protein n=1 Tax=Araneus ventricosus TaxID=182803 RepID=A0A4Y2DE02_ARAVE|nr:hypothetical protein AVEN_246607-1 [Araneus ventricosus]
MKLLFTRCLTDYIDVSTITIIGNKFLVGRYCGDDIPASMLFMNPHAEIIFKTNLVIHRKGFHGSYHFQDETADDADVHIMKTALETYEKIKKQVVIGQDVDLLVLPTALTPDYMDILMLKEGSGKIKDRFYSSKDLRNLNLVIECKKIHSLPSCVILFVHPFSSFMRLVVVTQL